MDIPCLPRQTNNPRPTNGRLQTAWKPATAWRAETRTVQDLPHSEASLCPWTALGCSVIDLQPIPTEGSAANGNRGRSWPYFHWPFLKTDPNPGGAINLAHHASESSDAHLTHLRPRTAQALHTLHTPCSPRERKKLPKDRPIPDPRSSIRDPRTCPVRVCSRRLPRHSSTSQILDSILHLRPRFSIPASGASVRLVSACFFPWSTPPHNKPNTRSKCPTKTTPTTLRVCLALVPQTRPTEATIGRGCLPCHREPEGRGRGA